ncbi:PTS lactose/cellobiose transporter subunit IIA [Klebsiella pneumoniae]|uniref:PTS lactose/cellobiose transporter subunit IIA n=1 Tax=Klebsiella pneumoniae TaxID=573 RepID=A0A927HJE0_KLEPN|nr:PTS lactose/cellobiose transporter subunit IIA [Klebsiella pneumoniae]
MKQAKQGDFAAAKAMMEQSRRGAERGASRADPAYRKRRGRRENEGQPRCWCMPEDHLMTSMLARELVAELIELHEKVQ